ncbi:unnamed protein product, partial [marine sediment metagenome]
EQFCCHVGLSPGTAFCSSGLVRDSRKDKYRTVATWKELDLVSSGLCERLYVLALEYGYE